MELHWRVELNNSVLFTSPGRRVELIEIFKKEFSDYRFIGGDFSEHTPASFFLDKMYQLPFKIDENYVQNILEICKTEKVKLVVPLIDPELAVFAKYRDRFEEIGTRVLLPNDTVIKIAHDKYSLYEYLKQNDKISLPKTVMLNDFKEKEYSYTDYVILKPKSGSSSIGIYKVLVKDVNQFSETESLDSNEYIVQEYIDFQYEVTVDVLGSSDGVLELCQRRRLKTRGGEVERGITMKSPKLSELIIEMDKIINIDSMINIQFMYSKNKDTFYLCEINSRFGGGFPLSYNAGASMVDLLFKDISNNPVESKLDSRYKDNFYMLRYDNAVYTPRLKS